MRLHHFEGHDDDGLFIDLDHVRTICEDGTREGYAIVHTDRTAYLVKGDYREIAKLVMGKAPEAEPAAKFQDKAPASTTYRFTVPGITSLVDVDLRDVLDSCEYSWQETRLMFRDGRPSLIVIMPPYKVADLLLKARSS